MRDLADFSTYEGNLPCVICKGDSSKTIMGDHWKCSACAHIFNADGSDPKVMCICDKCIVKAKKENEKQSKEFIKALKKLEKAAKRAEKKKTTD